MNKIIDKLINKINNTEDDDDLELDSIGDDNIKQVLPDCKIYTYNELKNKKIDDILPSNKSYCIILYQNTPNSGHWTCLLRKNNIIEYFDSYGGKIDEPLKWISKEKNLNLGIDKPFLSDMLKNSKYIFNYNDFDFQSQKNHEISTCGRWCILRLLLYKYSDIMIKDFQKIIQTIKKKLKKSSYDEIATRIIDIY